MLGWHFEWQTVDAELWHMIYTMHYAKSTSLIYLVLQEFKYVAPILNIWKKLLLWFACEFLLLQVKYPWFFLCRGSYHFCGPL